MLHVLRRSHASIHRSMVTAADALATVAGLHGALLLARSSGAPASATARGFQATLLLVGIRLAASLATGLHKWSFTSPSRLDAVRLVLTSAAGSAVFALVTPGLPAAIYFLEFFLTSSLLASVRFAPSVRDDVRQLLAHPSVDFARREWPRRALNVTVALVGLVLTLPLWIVIAAAIKATSRGPVFYLQERVGLDLRATGPHADDPRRKRDLGGRPFLMFKFRTMRVDAEAGTGAVWSCKDDPRVTRIGKLLRHCRLDELPQLINVLKGDMNVVGPRPERASIFADLRERLPRYALRQRARPGITGYAQVNLEYDASIEDVAEKLEYDLAYVTRASLTMDLEIMSRTLPVMLFRDRLLASRRRAERLTPALDDGAGT